MPDTGAPWNIPYVAGTDLVSDWPTDSLALANAIDAGLDAATVGIGTNVVSVTKVNSFSTTSTSYVDVTDMTVTITPSSATSKILVIHNAQIGNTAPDASLLALNRDGTNIAVSSDDITTWTGSRNAFAIYQNSIMHLDSPATTSAVVYKIRMKVASGTGTYNTVGSVPKGAVSNLTAIEVRA